jgi:hypothetical protein
MALAGAGNPVGGSNPAGTSSGLNYVGDHCYGYSGAVSVNQVETTLQDFSTGNSYLTVRWYPTLLENTNVNYKWVVKIDDQAIMNLSVDQQYGNMHGQYVDLILPPFARVVITGRNIEDTSSADIGSVITGRVYA